LTATPSSFGEHTESRKTLDVPVTSFGVDEALRWLEETALAETIRSGTWIYAAIESVHLLGLALLFGAVVALDLRLIGLSRSLSQLAMTRHLLPLAGAGFALSAVSGFLMFAADARALAGNPAFQLKLAFMVFAGINAAAFHLGPFRAIVAANGQRRPPGAAVIMGVGSLLLWMAVVVCGRLIAYV
jgi:hypothetical protein